MSAPAELQSWIGRTEVRTDCVTERPLQAWAATFDRVVSRRGDDAFRQTAAESSTAGEADDAWPPCWHWLYFLPLHPQSALGEDGHAERGGFLPPVPLPRRMWAGSRLEFMRSPRLGDIVTRTSRITAIDSKQGRDGPLVFVSVRHEVADATGPLVVEAQDIVYRGSSTMATSTSAKVLTQAPAAAAAPAPATPDWAVECRPDERLLFRFSALTFNSHRIHYDHPYATAVEGYPGLVVHGPLLAMLLLEALRENVANVRVTEFIFRAVRPAFVGDVLHLCGHRLKQDTVNILAHRDGVPLMNATAILQ